MLSSSPEPHQDLKSVKETAYIKLINGSSYQTVVCLLTYFRFESVTDVDEY